MNNTRPVPTQSARMWRNRAPFEGLISNVQPGGGVSGITAHPEGGVRDVSRLGPLHGFSSALRINHNVNAG